MGKALASRWVHLSNSAAPAKPHPWPGSRWEKYLRHSAARGHTETRSVGSSFTTGCHPDGTERFPWGDTQGCWQDRPGGNHHLVESQDFPRSLRPAAPPVGHLPAHGVPSPNLSDLPIFRPLSFFSVPLVIPTTPHRASVRESPADRASLIFLWLRRSDALQGAQC